MLTKEAIIDLASAKMTDQKAAEHLAALSIDTLTVELIKDFVNAIKGLSAGAILSSLSSAEPLIDCCGTGGSGVPHFNTSTATAFVLAAGGVNVAKFGGRSATGLSGSFDFLEALGISTVSDSNAVDDIFAETNLLFLFAPDFYPTFAKLAPIRKKLGVRTIFNVIGPLLNPANPNTRLLGTQRNHVQRLMAQYLAGQSEVRQSCVVSATSGLDELDPNSDNLCLSIRNGEIREISLLFKNTGDSPNHPLTTAENVQVFEKLIDDFDETPNYFKRLLTLNAGAAFELAGKSPSLEEGQNLASSLLRSGDVKEKFLQIKRAYAKHSR